jgi:hypothetical protein
MKSILISIIGCLIIVNCSTHYQPKGIFGGYSSIKTDENIFRVEFKGNQHTKATKVFDYLERRCAEITVENGFDYFIVYQDSSYIDETIFVDKPGLDDKIAAQRKDKYLLTEEQVIDTDPLQTLYDQKTKIGRTYNRSFIKNQSTDVIGVYKIILVDKIIENLKEYYYSANEILGKYKTEK